MLHIKVNQRSIAFFRWTVSSFDLGLGHFSLITFSFPFSLYSVLSWLLCCIIFWFYFFVVKLLFINISFDIPVNSQIMCCRISIETTCLLSQLTTLLCISVVQLFDYYGFSDGTYIRVTRINIQTVLSMILMYLNIKRGNT